MPDRSHDAVLFDFYGTLTEAVHRGPGHQRVAEILGCSLEDMIALLDESFYPRARGEMGDALTTLRWLAGRLGVRVTAAQLHEAQAARVEAITADTRLRADAVATLRRCRGAGLRIALVSDCCWELPDLLRRLPVAPLLDTAIFSVHIGACKPDPTIYLAACAALRVAPARCLFIGDGGSQELSGAKALGMTAVRLAAPDLAEHLVFRSDEAFRGPVATSLSQFGDVATDALSVNVLNSPALI